MDTTREFTKAYLRNSLVTKDKDLINSVYTQIKDKEKKIASLQKQLINEKI